MSWSRKHPSPWYYSAATGGITNTTAVALIAATHDTTHRNFVSSFQYHNKSAVASEIVIEDGTTVIWRGYAPASMSYPADISFDPPLMGSPGNALNVALITTSTATYVNAQGFEGI